MTDPDPLLEPVPAGFVRVHLPDLSGETEGRYTIVSVPKGYWPESVVNDVRWWWRERHCEPESFLLEGGSSAAPRPRPRVRLILGAHESEVAGMVEVTLGAFPVEGYKVLRRWTYESTLSRARVVYESYKRNARRWARAVGLAVVGTVEQAGTFGGRKADSF